MATLKKIQYVSNQKGKAIAVIVPIEVWREIESGKETAYLLRNPVMKKRLLEAKKRTHGISLEDARAKLGI